MNGSKQNDCVHIDVIRFTEIHENFLSSRERTAIFFDTITNISVKRNASHLSHHIIARRISHTHTRRTKAFEKDSIFVFSTKHTEKRI